MTLEQALDLVKAHHEAARFPESIEICRNLLNQNPQSRDAWNYLGASQMALGQLPQAEATFRGAISANAATLGTMINLAIVLRDLARPNESIDILTQAINLRPDIAPLWNHLGAAFIVAARCDEAIAALQRAIALQPTLAEAHSNLSTAQRDAGLIEQAIASAQRSVELAPGLVDAHNNLARAFSQAGQTQEAIDAYRRALAIRPDHHVIASNLLLELNYLPQADADAVFREHREWWRDAAWTQQLNGGDNAAFAAEANRSRLRIGYVSSDFREHAVAYFVEGILKHHDRKAFEVFCYSNVQHPDATTVRLRSLAQNWREIRGVPDGQAARLIRQDQIDLLVDLNGHTAENRLPLFALKPATVQVTYLGYPNTTGMRTIDWRLTDERADPPSADAHYTEKLWRLPDSFLCYLPPANAPAIGMSARQANRPITFTSLNALRKTNPRVLEVWGRILQRNPGSRLLLKAAGLETPSLRRNVIDALAKHGIAPDRIETQGTVATIADQLAFYQRADIALDTFPYNGTTTTCEALWMGVPVITLAGNIHAARVGVSVLTTVGLSQFIARDATEYVRLATQLAEDQDQLEEFRCDLRQRMSASPLMDQRRFVRNLENGYREMWKLRCAQER